MRPGFMMNENNFGDGMQDEQLEEQIKLFEKMIAGTDFEKELDSFIEKQMESGVSPDEIIN